VAHNLHILGFPAYMTTHPLIFWVIFLMDKEANKFQLKKYSPNVALATGKYVDIQQNVTGK